ncbi:MAG TPA: hypothetical protein VGG35_02465 [Streptosporangiaceae bacterium]
MDPVIPRELYHRPSPGQPPGVLRRSAWRLALPAGIALVITFPVAVWWCVGDLSTVPLSADPDYAIRPLAISPTVERLAGTGSAGIAAVALIVLVLLTARRRLAGPWWQVLAPLLGAGLLAGAGWRAMTAGVIGADIGAGLLVITGCPAITGLLLWSAERAVSVSRRPRQ